MIDSSVLREALLERISSIGVRNLSLDSLPDTICELSVGDEVVFRSGRCNESLNPNWSLQQQMKRSYGCLESSVLNELIKIQIIQIPPNSSHDFFPYHHHEKPDGTQVLLEMEFRIEEDLELLETPLGDPKRVYTLEDNSIIVTLHESNRMPRYYRISKGYSTRETVEEEEEEYTPEQLEQVSLLVSKLQSLIADRTSKEALVESKLESRLSESQERHRLVCKISQQKQRQTQSQELSVERNRLQKQISARRAFTELRATRLHQVVVSEEDCFANDVNSLQKQVDLEAVLIRAHRINLLRSVMSIYPLHEKYTDDSGSTFTVRGISLPTTFGNNNSEEEQVSTAFGYLAHCVHLVSKYLDIPLRYVALPRSSNSTICDPLTICLETPHEPLGVYQAIAAPSCPPYIFGNASGRLAKSAARKALQMGSYPLYWKGLTKAQRSSFNHAVELLTRDANLMVHVHQMRTGSMTSSKGDSHIIAQLRKVLLDF